MLRAVGLLCLVAAAATAAPFAEQRAAEPVKRQQFIGANGEHLTTLIGLGEPPQFFELALSLDDDHIVVLDQSTANSNVDFSYDYIKNLFSPPGSGTAKNINRICRLRQNYYHTFGQYIHDVVTFGDYQFKSPVRFCDLNLTREAQSTGQDELAWLMKEPIDGYLGLKPGGENLIEKILPEGERQVTFTLASKVVDPDEAGTITLGSRDTVHCRDYNVFPSDDVDSWRLWAQEIQFGQKTDKNGPYSVRFDFNSDYLYLPTIGYQMIATHFSNQMNQVSCSTGNNAPKMTFRAFGKEIQVPIKDYVIPINKNNPSQCRVHVSATRNNDEDEIVIGRQFLKSFCMNLDFDEATIALAPVRTSSD